MTNTNTNWNSLPLYGDFVKPILFEKNGQPFIHTENNIVVLLAERNMETIGNLVALLSRNVRVYVAVNVGAVINYLKEITPDIILIGPGLNDMGTKKQNVAIKKAIGNKTIPFIEILADNKPETRLASLNSGVDYCVCLDQPDELLFWIGRLKFDNKQQSHGLSNARGFDSGNNIGVSGDYDQIFLQRLYKILDEHLGDESFSTIALCEEMKMSRTQLHRKIKGLTGCPAGEYIRNYRLDRAYAFLKNDSIKVNEVMYMTGYKKMSWFATSFKERHGILPSQVKHK